MIFVFNLTRLLINILKMVRIKRKYVLYKLEGHINYQIVGKFLFGSVVFIDTFVNCTKFIQPPSIW